MGDPRSLGYARDAKPSQQETRGDRKSTRLNSSHLEISYAVFCLKKKKTKQQRSLVPILVGTRGTFRKISLKEAGFSGATVWRDGGFNTRATIDDIDGDAITSDLL